MRDGSTSAKIVIDGCHWIGVSELKVKKDEELFEKEETKTTVPGDTDNSGDGTAKPIGRDETPNGNIGAMQERKSDSHTKDLICPAVVDNYGAWMIVSRERRRPNRATDKRDQRVNKTGKAPAKNKQNEEMMGSGSRFKALDEEVVEGHDVTGERLVMNQEETNQNKTNVNSGYSAGNNGNKGNKGKQPTVQANEKQISRNNLHRRHKVQSARSEAGTSGGEIREMIRNRVAASDEHVLVQGNKHDVTNVQRISGEDHIEEVDIDVQILTNPEHHYDPPPARSNLATALMHASPGQMSNGKGDTETDGGT
nr:hypothetical protein DM860_014690 [Ipomoea batatas]